MFQTNWVYSNVNQGRVYPNCKFHDLRGRGSCARMWPYKSYSEYFLSSTLSIYSTLIAILLRDYDAAFLYHGWFSFNLWWAVDIQIWVLLWQETRSQCKVSDPQLTVKACEHLVSFFRLMEVVLAAKVGEVLKKVLLPHLGKN